jgi:hypothetical protein
MIHLFCVAQCTLLLLFLTVYYLFVFGKAFFSFIYCFGKERNEKVFVNFIPYQLFLWEGGTDGKAGQMGRGD